MKQLAASSAEAWEALCVEQFQTCQVDWAVRSFNAELRSSTQLPNISLTRLKSGGFGVSRTFAHTRKNDADDLMVVIHHSGQQGKIEHNGSRSIIQSGGAVLIDTARAYCLDFAGPVEQTVIKLPRSATRLVAKNAGQPIGAEGSASLRVLDSILRELERIDSGMPEHEEVDDVSDLGRALAADGMREADALINAAVEMAGVAFAGWRSSGANSGHEALLYSAQEFVRARLWDSRLGPETIAGHLGASLRFVSGLFAEHGSSPAAFIRDARLEKARYLLTSTERQNTAIFDVAVRVGFVDATTFSRAFRRKYGMVPSEYRREAWAQASNSGTLGSDQGRSGLAWPGSRGLP
ncbi:helix-turn-helix domain-containing protein [Arthrobacter sp. NPDC093128]|uniref:helix-turn-helix domain-containing protein n=1 Tax=Arthrobacter sp. NPDC093128 TaxID=3154979 RepID=UPI0034343549